MPEAKPVHTQTPLLADATRLLKSSRPPEPPSKPTVRARPSCFPRSRPPGRPAKLPWPCRLASATSRGARAARGGPTPNLATGLWKEAPTQAGCGACSRPAAPRCSEGGRTRRSWSAQQPRAKRRRRAAAQRLRARSQTPLSSELP